jgi:hypothetical protein
MFGTIIQEIKKVVENFLREGVERNRMIGVGAYFVRLSIQDDLSE